MRTPLWLLTLLALAAPALAGPDDEPYLKNIRQLTKGDKRAGEAYFSADGKKILFQAVRGEQPYYQIYVINADGSGRRMVSTGKGKTTCAFFHPKNSNLFIYASSHLDERTHTKPKQKRRSRRYLWDYDDSFDIFLADTRTGKIVKQLTTERGYDAECSYSPDGKLIAYTARRKGKADSIYLMNADGTKPRVLVRIPDIDCGGPFFSPDGKWVTYRASMKGSRTMQVFMTSVDGKQTKQLTRVKRVNWAPFFHPTGKVVAFAAPAPGSYRDFNLILLKTDGSTREVQLTSDKGFDGLPAFSPDGKTIVWSSSRGGRYPQVYMAEFVMPPEHAFKKPKGKYPTSKGPFPGHKKTTRPGKGHGKGHENPHSRPSKKTGLLIQPRPLNHTRPLPGLLAIRSSSLMRDVAWLADDRRQGRRAGTRGAWESAGYIATRLGELGVRPGGIDGSWFQEFSYSKGGRRAPNGNSLAVSEQAWVLDQDFRPLLYSSSGKVQGQLAFAGYGIRAREHAYDDLAGIDLKGKVALVLTGAPRSSNGGAFGEKVPSVYQDLRYKIATCRDAGAAAVILVRPRDSGWLQLSSGDPGIPVVQATRQAVERKLALNLRALVGRIDGSGAPASRHMRQQVAVGVRLQRITGRCRNVIGRIQGSTRPEEVIVLGAHYDHLGFGGDGSLAVDERAIHNGADDNASGTAGLIALAEAFLAARPQRTVLLVGFGAEEEGLIGSKRFVKYPPLSRKRIVAMLNMDMIGRLGSKRLMVGGYGTSPAWPAIVQRAATLTQRPLQGQRDGFGPSDHASFYASNIPVFFLWTGTHVDYHKPSDDTHKVDARGLLHATRVAYILTRGIDALPQRPAYRRVKREHRTRRVVTGRRGAYFGSIPNYAQDGKSGVLLDGARPGTPAAKAGIKKGDVVVEFKGMTIKTIYDYVNALRLCRPGQTVKVVVKRAGKRVTLKATLGTSRRGHRRRGSRRGSRPAPRRGR